MGSIVISLERRSVLKISCGEYLSIDKFLINDYINILNKNLDIVKNL